ncbi:uncharacterized protein Z520_02005 [Fonsecaea multimorphosa CBS 102226]|uniref:Uncharacterized protein n=1 Tax=Fonsecaea multimorphosa CBS 102226 TaxID=1442371 RepID=A0A0D2IXW9_9EURO|nr:uncharacterized protein Z520_02005 [Fonsecaea multimorphosa CBS 102226]KIY01867.1 hypothetical protein Z520_02005 [Fonsecaea multimorphosa CBS 102226]OAL29552.1 hypothetical protein AYO22_01966 [Fonsecaea multimorphosa]
MGSTTSKGASNKIGGSNTTSRTPAEEEAAQSLHEFWIRAWQEHDAALVLQKMRTETPSWAPYVPDDLRSRHSSPTIQVSNGKETPSRKATATARVTKAKTGVVSGSSRANKAANRSKAIDTKVSGAGAGDGAGASTQSRVARAASRVPALTMSLRQSNSETSARLSELLNGPLGEASIGWQLQSVTIKDTTFRYTMLTDPDLFDTTDERGKESHNPWDI